jgi:hypothetical protein
VWEEVPRKGKTDRLIHSRLNDGRLSALVKIQPVHLVSFKPVRTGLGQAGGRIVHWILHQPARCRSY